MPELLLIYSIAWFRCPWIKMNRWVFFVFFFFLISDQFINRCLLVINFQRTQTHIWRLKASWGYFLMSSIQGAVISHTLKGVNSFWAPSFSGFETSCFFLSGNSSKVLKMSYYFSRMQHILHCLISSAAEVPLVPVTFSKSCGTAGCAHQGQKTFSLHELLYLNSYRGH